MYLSQSSGVEFYAYVSQVGNLKLDKSYTELDLTKIDDNDVRCPDQEAAQKFGIQVRYTPGAFTEPVADSVLGGEAEEALVDLARSLEGGSAPEPLRPPLLEKLEQHLKL